MSSNLLPNRLSLGLSLGLIFVVAAAIGIAAESTPATPPSKYAPAKALESQVAEYIADIDKALASEDAYTPAARGRVFKMAHTLSAMALVLGHHDEPNEINDHAAAVVGAAGKLAANYEDYAAASAALAELKKAVAGETAAGEPLPWKKVADLPALMEQVPVVNSKLKRGVRRLERNQDEAAAQAATLAAIAQASIFDHSAADEDQVDEWVKYCEQLRSAAAETGDAIRALDEEGVEAGVDKIQQSCDDCHAVFQ